MFEVIARSLFIAVAVAIFGIGAVGSSATVVGQARQQNAAHTGLPDALKRAAISTRSDRRGEIAGAQIGSTGVYVVYIKTANGCGSGGCRAQVWKRENARFVQHGSLPVGYLPIVVFPKASDGMPLLGVTVFDKDSAGLAVLPVGFDGTGYGERQDIRLLPANSGSSLLTRVMLRRF